MPKNSKQIILGLLGTIGSGKSTASDYLIRRHKFKRVIMGNLVRELTRKKRLTTTRKNLWKVQKYYRKKYGADFFINLTVGKIKKSGWKRAIIDGIRTPTDSRVAMEACATLIFIDALPELRFARLKKRKRVGYSKTLKQFKNEEAAEWKLFKFKTTLKYIDYKIENNGTKKEFLKKIDRLMERLIK